MRTVWLQKPILEGLSRPGGFWLELIKDGQKDGWRLNFSEDACFGLVYSYFIPEPDRNLVRIKCQFCHSIWYEDCVGENEEEIRNIAQSVIEGHIKRGNCFPDCILPLPNRNVLRDEVLRIKNKGIKIKRKLAKKRPFHKMKSIFNRRRLGYRRCTWGCK